MVNIQHYLLIHFFFFLNVQVSMEPSVFLEVENEVSVVAGSRLSQLRVTRDGRDWNTLLPSSVVTAAGSR